VVEGREGSMSKFFYTYKCIVLREKGRKVNFRLNKLYLDCIDEKGNCFILYRADLNIFFLTLHYSSLIFSDQSGIVTEKSSLKKTSDVHLDDKITLENKQLHIKGTWERADSPLHEFEWTDLKTGVLSWNCHHPKTNTELEFRGRVFSGLGYAESLFLTIKPWNLPIEELRWGRFLSESYTIVWIKWSGKKSLNKLFCNGKEFNDAIFEEENIIFDCGKSVLMFEKVTIIRNERLEGILKGKEWLRIFFKNKFLKTIETKYKAETKLKAECNISATGWSLFEKVIWER